MAANTLQLDILRELREEAGLTQDDMARLCGLQGQMRRQTAGAWERGDIIPTRARRIKVIGYLWDHLHLRRDPARFDDVWEILMREWGWDPISDKEWTSFTQVERPSRDGEVEEKLAALSATVAQLQQGKSVPVQMPASVTPTMRSPLDTLPPRAYRHLIGREKLIHEILDALHDRDGERIIAIDGMGGIGKTTIAQEVVRRSLTAGSYEGALWVSITHESSGPGADGAFHFESVLNAIGHEIGDRDIYELPLAEKERRVKQYLREQRLIVVLDGLEAVAADQTPFVQRLFALLSTSKAIITSRLRFSGDLFLVHLDGLPEQASSELIEQVASERRIHAAQGVKQDEANKIFATTGGSPLALKLVVGQLEYEPMPIILERLRRVASPIAGRSDEYTQLYRHIFWPSWELLDEDCKELLVGLSHFAPGLGGTFTALQRLNLYTDLSLAVYVETLWRFSLLEIGDSTSIDKRRYYLHALTQHFVQSDIVVL